MENLEQFFKPSQSGELSQSEGDSSDRREEELKKRIQEGLEEIRRRQRQIEIGLQIEARIRQIENIIRSGEGGVEERVNQIIEKLNIEESERDSYRDFLTDFLKFIDDGRVNKPLSDCFQEFQEYLAQYGQRKVLITLEKGGGEKMIVFRINSITEALKEKRITSDTIEKFVAKSIGEEGDFFLIVGENVLRIKIIGEVGKGQVIFCELPEELSDDERERLSEKGVKRWSETKGIGFPPGKEALRDRCNANPDRILVIRTDQELGGEVLISKLTGREKSSIS
jgi:hypothetical protein